MYIKIRHIKQFLLFSACVFFAVINYFSYVKADDSREVAPTICDKTLDSDCDGLTDAEEKLYGTDPKIADTDGDSYSDGVEVKSGYDPLKAAPGDKLASTNDQLGAVDTIATESSVTSNFSQDLESFVTSKGATPISSDDINTFVTEKITAQTGDPITLETLPSVDTTSIKIIDQTYPNLSEDDKKKKLQDDAKEYYLRIAYLLMSNSPRPILSADDVISLFDEFKGNLTSFATTTTNFDYFIDMADRLDLLTSQMLAMEVPQTFLDSHIKIIRIAKGYLSLRETFLSSDNDPLLKMVIISKAQELNGLLISFLQNEFSSYNTTLGL